MGTAAVTVFDEVTVSALVAIAVFIGTDLTPTDGTEDDGAVEGTTAGVGFTDSGRVTLVCFVDCNAEVPPPPPPRGLFRSLAPPTASFIVAAGSGGAGGAFFING
jgi:hypothetical protein